MSNCTAAGFTNCSTKNPNIRFHKNMMSGSKILRGKNPVLRTSISVPSILKDFVLKEIWR